MLYCDCTPTRLLSDVYERQTCMTVTALTQGRCQLFLQSTTKPASMLLVLGNTAVHQASYKCPALLHSISAQDSIHAFWLIAVLQKQQTAASYHCNSLMQVCLLYKHLAIAQHCCTALQEPSKHAFWLITALQKQQTAALCHCSSNYATLTSHTDLQVPNTVAKHSSS